MVHGKCCGSFHLVAPVATKSCGTFLAFMYFWIAVLDGVPSDWKIKRTSSLSTSLRACSTVLGGLYPSSFLMKLTVRPVMPHSALTFLKYAASVFPISPYAEAGQ